MGEEVMLDRRNAIATLLKDRPDDLLIVSGLGSATYDVASVGDDDRNFYLWGAMGGAAVMGLGLAVAQPQRRVAVVTGDGEMLMGMGALATVGVQKPDNLCIVIFDNGLYGETGAQQSHTGGGVDLPAVARACGLTTLPDVTDAAGLEALAAKLRGFDQGFFVRVRIQPQEAPRVLPLRDGVALKLRFRAALGFSPG